MRQPDILLVMTDQQRFDTIAALGNRLIYTPNLDRLVRRGVSFTNAYTTCPVCVAARYGLHTGCLPPTTGCFENEAPRPVKGQARSVSDRCGAYLAATMRGMGYRTFGIGKFHTIPEEEDLGFDVHLRSEELYKSPNSRAADAYASFIERQHPQFAYIENLMGERTEMYYMPQMRPVPAEVAVESWATDRAIEQIEAGGSAPYFGFVSFIGPHPPLAPPIPFNRMYDPDRMPDPVKGDRRIDHLDEQIPFMNYAVWAEDISDAHARVLKARYYGQISYIDQCLGRILDTVESRGRAGNTLICFFSDHGDHMGDHHAWQKESFFEASARVPFLLSWPAKLPRRQSCDALVGLHDLFAIATGAAGRLTTRQGMDVLGMLRGEVSPRQRLVSYYGRPGTPRFKLMVRQGVWKYIRMANGDREQLFNLKKDPREFRNLARSTPAVLAEMRNTSIGACDVPGARDALTGRRWRLFPFTARPLQRIYQFDHSRGVTSFPRRPQDVLRKATQNSNRRVSNHNADRRRTMKAPY
jgi:arylsulfatase